MKRYFILLVLLTGLCVTLSELGLTGLPFEGKWSASGTLGDGEFGWYQNYEFRAGHYSMEGYPPISESGSYSVVLQDGNNYTLLMEPTEGELEPSGDPFLIKLSVYEDSMTMSSYSATGGMTFTH